MNVPCFSFLLLIGVGLPLLAWVLLGRSLRRAVPDQARRGRAWGRKLRIERGSALWRNLCLSVVCFLAGVVVLRLRFGIRFPIRLSLWATLVLMGVMIVLVYVQLYMGHRRTNRFFNHLEAEDHLRCPDCHYSLSAHRQGSRCPECGYEFTPESLLADWADVKKMARRRGA